MEFSNLAIIENPIYQLTNEQVVYDLDTYPWGGSPTSPALKIFDKSGADVTSSVTTGSFSVNGDILTLPKIQNLAVSSSPYMMLIEFTTGVNRFSPWSEIRAR